MVKTLLRVLVLAAGASGLASGARAELIASASFAGSPGDQRAEAIDALAPGFAISGLERGPGLRGVASLNTMTLVGFPTGTTFDPASDYLFFVITPDAGTAVSLDRVEFGHRATGAGPALFQVRTSLDGFSAPVGPSRALNKTGSLALAGLDFGDAFEELTGPIEVRIYGTGALSDSGGLILGDLGGTPGFQVFGRVGTSAVVPEPSSIALAVCGVGALCFIARRQRDGNSRRRNAPAG